MTRQKLLLVLFFIALLMLGIGIYIESRISKKPQEASYSSGSAYAASNSDTISIKFDDTFLKFRKVKSVTQTFMVFGLAAHDINENGRFTNGFLGGIPLTQAKKMLKKYPNMSRCGAPGSQEAQNAVQDFLLITNSPDVQKKLVSTAKEFDDSLRKKASRICVQITGQTLQPSADNAIQIRGGSTNSWFHLQNISTVPCI